MPKWCLSLSDKEEVMRKTFYVIVIATITATAPGKSGGQSSTSVSAGPTYVFGAAAEWSGPGYNVQVSKEFGHFGPAVFRADALYMQRSGSGRTFSSANERTYAAAGSVLLRRSIGRVAPFALVGLGLYGDNSWAVYTPGINAGIGMEVSIAQMHLFAESRIHQYLRDARDVPGSAQHRDITQVPISFGLRF
ncbi:MAG TPA: hypothetical protein VGN73_00225 [Gemmatimonadaceae bacterium]|nr:hypothetical protein [Gemmatimonadaceae bacterium]